MRVTGNCALCHAPSYISGQDSADVLQPVRPGSTLQRKRGSRASGQCDKPSLADRLLYRYVLILRTKKALTDPEKVIFALELQVHARNPQAGWQGYRSNE